MELADLFNVAWKSAHYGSQESECLEALNDLLHFPVSSQVLALASAQTDVLKRLHSLTGHPRLTIKNLSSSVYAAWNHRMLNEFVREEEPMSDDPPPIINPFRYINVNGKRVKLIIKKRHYSEIAMTNILDSQPSIKPETPPPPPELKRQKNLAMPHHKPDTTETSKQLIPEPEIQKPPMKRQQNIETSKQLIPKQQIQKPPMKRQQNAETSKQLIPKPEIQKPPMKRQQNLPMPLQKPDKIETSNKPQIQTPPKKKQENLGVQKLMPKRQITKPKRQGIPMPDRQLQDNQPHLRDNVKEQILQGLSMVFQEVQDDSELNRRNAAQIASSIESLLFAKWGFSNTGCRPKYRSLLFNIKDPKNPDFRRKLLLGTIKPEEVADMSPQEMASDDRKRENQVILARKSTKNAVN
ncbi:transcription elongation factor TFIIS-like [Mercurialis annua]|uniref:transcription elongation factor TFIIS-like n=1 Tax=Mercurialis annua TaxID=3986 RepID=UPI00215EC0B4|nr:transcription elongation factor TFIIS-like [Mercurialis annua]